jgi:hypothetical protein
VALLAARRARVASVMLTCLRAQVSAAFTMWRKTAAERGRAARVEGEMAVRYERALAVHRSEQSQLMERQSADRQQVTIYTQQMQAAHRAEVARLTEAARRVLEQKKQFAQRAQRAALASLARWRWAAIEPAFHRWRQFTLVEREAAARRTAEVVRAKAQELEGTLQNNLRHAKETARLAVIRQWSLRRVVPVFVAWRSLVQQRKECERVAREETEKARRRLHPCLATAAPI